MLIDKDLPLPEHTKYDYYECYAKVLLEKFIFKKDNYLDLKDKPDLQNTSDDIGIEVVQAINPKQLEAEKLYSQHAYSNENDKIKKETQISKCGARLDNGILFGISGTDSFKLINEQISKKIQKFASHNYTKFKFKYIFVFSHILASAKMLEKQLEHLISINTCQLSGVFVSVPGGIYVFDLNKENFYSIDIESSMQYKLAMQARDLVINLEELVN